MTLEHAIVYRQPGRFAGWPANYGSWSWGDEIVVGFTLGYTGHETGIHTRDKSRPFLPMQARSYDGGQTWVTQQTPCHLPGGRGFSADEHMVEAHQVGLVMDGIDGPKASPGHIDFSHPDFAMMVARSGLGPGTKSWFYVSYDRCRSWQGPFWLPMFDQMGIEGRTDYIVDGPDSCTLFLTATKNDRPREAQLFCARTTDGGKTFQFLSWIGPKPEGGISIMPASVRLSDSKLLVAGREHRDGKCWIDVYVSKDNGHSWAHLSKAVSDTGEGGSPATLTMLDDGRLAMTYGYRNAPFGIRAVTSDDEGATWSDPVVLRDDGGYRDLGYPRAVKRADGKVVVSYYYNDERFGERYIGATVWQP